MIKEAFLRGFIGRHGVGSLGKKDATRLVSGVKERGLDALTAMPLRWLSKKTLGDRRTRQIGHKLHQATLNADMIAGKPLNYLAEKLPIGKDLFKQDEMLQTGKDTFKKIIRPSATAPLGSAAQIAVPMIAADAIMEKVQKHREERDRKKLEAKDGARQEAVI